MHPAPPVTITTADTDVARVAVCELLARELGSVSYLDALAVHAGHRGAGIGSALVAEPHFWFYTRLAAS
jgi:GNAT superfamily N-acetyltransferase